MQLQRDENKQNSIEWSWGKGIRPDLLENTDVTLFSAAMPIYGESILSCSN